MELENIFGQRIFELRKSAGLTQKQLGEIVGLSMQAINDIEKGRRETTITKAILIARYFNTTVEYLMGDTDNLARPTDEHSLIESLFAEDTTLPFAIRLRELQTQKQVPWDSIIEILQSVESPDTMEKVLALADYFDVSLDYLVGRSEVKERR